MIVDIPVVLDRALVTATIKLPCSVYKGLAARPDQKYREWVAVRHRGCEYYGRPLPSLLECIVVCDSVKLNTGECGERVSVRFLDKVPTLSSVLISGPLGDVVVAGSLLGPGFSISCGLGVEVSVVQTCPPSVGLVTPSTVISVQKREHAVPDGGAQKGSLERAFADLAASLTRQSVAAVCGVKGSGKAWTSERVAALLKLPFMFVAAPDFLDSRCKDRALYYVDGAEELCPSRDLQPKKTREMISFHNKLMDISSFTQSRFVLGFRETRSVDPAYTAKWLRDAIWLGVPDAKERMYILDKNAPFDATLTATIANLSTGFLFSDLIRLINVIRSNTALSIPFDLRGLINEFSGSVQSRFKMDIDRSLTWDSLGGLTKVRDRVKQIIEDPLRYATEFKANRLSPPRGLLLHGPPGCSKTSIAKAIANSTGLPFYSLDTAAVFSCYLGESERLIRELFAAARQTRPSIVFLDEIDVIVGRRGGPVRDPLQERLVATFLTEMDGIENADGVLVVGATNRLDSIDPAFLRPGRMDHIVEVPLPDHVDRLDILNKLCHMAGIPLDDDQLVSQRTAGHSAADLKGLVSSIVLAGHKSVNAEVVEEVLRGSGRVVSRFKV